MSIQFTSKPFGRTKDGRQVTCFCLENSHGMAVEILDWGCVIRSVLVPNQKGGATDVVLGYDTMEGYEAGSCFFGAFVGRYANRIKGAAFPLNGKTYQLEPNDGRNHLHGVYSTSLFESSREGDALVLRRHSPDGEEGYPGAVEIEVRYTLSEENALAMEYRARATADTVINLTNHSYFNLAGQGNGDVLEHQLQLGCGRFTEADAETLPTGRILPVDGTVMDFRTPRRLGEGIQAQDSLLALTRGYDHNLIFEGEAHTGWAFCPQTGIRMEMTTTQPAVQLYTGNNIDHDRAACGKGGVRYPRYGGFCLETQHYPCSPNFPDFPSTLLRAGEAYRQRTVYRFQVAPRQ